MEHNIDKETHKLEGKNYYRAKHDKHQIILGGSLRGGDYGLVHMKNKEGGNSKKWFTFTIARDGKIYQHYNPKYYSDYMGVKEIDKHSISIVLENMGSVYYDYIEEMWTNWAGEVCAADDVYEKYWNGTRYWERYTDEQFDATVDLCCMLCKEHDIELDSLGYNNHLRDSHKFLGIVTRSNLSMDFEDLNPSFNFKKFLIEIGVELDDI